MSESQTSSSARWVIAIDGPAGAGKSTTAKALARELGLRYLDTGAMYRAIALKASRLGIKGDEGQRAAELLETTEIGFGAGEPQPVFLDGEEVTNLIRTNEIGDLASALSAHTPVRKALVARQQAMVAAGGVILEGRDATTVIAPQADVKVYLTASLEERSRRRHVEFGTKGIEASFESVRSQIEIRDHRDITREDSPLSVAPDATIVESGCRSIEDVIADIKALLPKA